MNIAIGKFGRSLFFDKEYRKAGKGDLAPMASYITLAKRHPECTFYLIGASDLYKSGKDNVLRKMNEIPDNIIDLYHIAKKTGDLNKPICERIVELIKDRNISFDYGIFFQGPDLKINTPYIYKSDGTTLASPLQMSLNYSGPIVHTINSFKFPYIIVNEDPRYVPITTGDLFNDETCILSHLNAHLEVDRYVGYFEESLKSRKHELDYVYTGIERTSLLFLKKYDYRNYKDFVIPTNKLSFASMNKHYKKNGFMFIVCNESPNRFKNIKKWILDVFPNVKIYGRWNKDTVKGYEDRFVNKSMAYLQDELWSSKYTFIPGFFDKMTNFVTIKFWEMCIYGIMPFFDKSKYDSDNLLPISDFFRVENPEEMKKRINLLESDENLYSKYLNEIYSLVDDKYFNGDFIDQIFKPIFDKNGKDVTIEDFRQVL